MSDDPNTRSSQIVPYTPSAPALYPTLPATPVDDRKTVTVQRRIRRHSVTSLSPPIDTPDVKIKKYSSNDSLESSDNDDPVQFLQIHATEHAIQGKINELDGKLKLYNTTLIVNKIKIQRAGINSNLQTELENNQLQERILEIQNSKKKLDNQLKQLQENLEDAQQVIAEHQTQAKYTEKLLRKRAKQALDAQYGKYCENLNEKDNQIRHLIEAYEQQITQYKADLDGRATEINRLRQSQLQDQEQIEYIRSEVSSYETYTHHLLNQYEQLRITHDADLIQLQTFNDTIQELNRLNEKSQVETSNIETELKDQIAILTQTTTQLQEDNNQLKH